MRHKMSCTTSILEMTKSQLRFDGGGHGCAAAVRSTRPICLGQRSSKWYTTTTVGIGLFTDSFLYSVIIPILPYSLQSQYNIPKDETQFWTSTIIVSYGAAILIASPVIGFIADTTKARRCPYMSGLLMLLISTAMLYLGRDIFILISARILQGVSAAVVWVVGLALLVDVAGNQYISRAMGFAALGSSSAILLGPLLGGLMYDRIGLPGMYCVCLVLLLINAMLRLCLIEKHTARRWLENQSQIDAASTSSIINGESASNPASPPRHPSVLLLLTSGRLLCAIYSTFVSAILISTFDAIIPLFALRTLGLSSTGAGLVFAAVVVPGFLSPMIGWLCDRYGARWIVSSGYILLSPLLLSLRFVNSGGMSQMALFCCLLGGIGLCYSMVNIPILSEYTHVVAQRQAISPGIFGYRGVYAQAYGIYNIAYSAGLLIGPLMGGLVMENYGWNVMTASLSICCGLSAVVTAIFCGERRGSSTTTTTRDEKSEEV